MSASRPYVDRPVPDRDRAAAAAEQWATRWGLPAPVLLRHGMNSLYQCGDVIVRVGATTAPAASAHVLADWLLDHGIATVPPVAGLTADAPGLAVTAWKFVRATGAAIDWQTVGALVRSVHGFRSDAVPAEYPLADPTRFAWWDFDALLLDVGEDLDARARDGIVTTIEHHRGWAAALARDPVVCHGDVHPGNVLMSTDGPLLIDWDLMCIAHPAWDLAMLSTYADRWGGDHTAYQRFVAGYGEVPDPMLTAALADLRNVAATLMRVRAGRHDQAAAAEAEQRLRYWRGDPDAPPWRAQ